MPLPHYQQTPPGIMLILNLFTQHRLSYLLFKCEHIFEGQNKNLDILFKTTEDYHHAAVLLQQQGFVIRLSEKIERYKTMYCGLIEGTMYSVHLHREIAWHGMRALDKQPVFQRAQHLNSLIIIPGLEDSILIHAAHVLFENFKVKEREKNYFLKLDEPAIDKEYIRWQIRKNHWEKGFWTVIKSEHISKREVAQAWMGKVWKEPATLTYLFQKALRIPWRKLSFKRRGCLMALIGVNGSGKSTLSKTLIEHYTPITTHLGKAGHYYYYGWKPTFMVTRWLSALLKMRKKEIFKEVNINVQPKRFDLFQEMQFCYIYFEFLYRYLTEIKPLLKQDYLVVTDRYFYDIYGQYGYAQNSFLLPVLVAIFPKPTITYNLTINLKELQQRKKTDQNGAQLKTKERVVLPERYLQQQQENYAFLANLLKINTVDTGKDVPEIAGTIIKETWKKII